MEVRRIQSRAWLNHALWLTGLSLANFARVHVVRGRERSGLAYKWNSGRTIPTRRYVQSLEEQLPGTAWVYDHPMWELLQPRRIPLKRIEELLVVMTRGEDEGRHWFFPGDADELASGRTLPLASIESPDVLARRGDLWAFTGCLLLARRAEARLSDQEFYLSILWTYRAVVGALRQVWLLPLWSEILDALDRLRRASLYCSEMVRVDRDVILAQASDPDFQPWRELRMRDPQTGRFVEVEDPIRMLVAVAPEFLGGLVFNARGEEIN